MKAHFSQHDAVNEAESRSFEDVNCINIKKINNVIHRKIMLTV